MDEMDRIVVQVITSIVTTAIGFLGGLGLEFYKHTKKKEVETQRGKQAKEAILYGKKCESYVKLLSVLGKFHEKVLDGKLVSSDQKARSAADEVELTWIHLSETAREGVYSESVRRELNTYLNLNCWKPLRTQNLSDPEAPRISDPVAFWNAVFNTIPGTYYLAVRDAIDRDLSQLPPVRYIHTDDSDE